MAEENVNIGFIESCDVPSVYSNKQSYYEVLCYINYKLNELIDVYNQLEFDYKSYVDNQLQGVKDYADENIAKQSKTDREYTLEKMDNAIYQSQKYTNDEITEVNRKLESNYNLILKNIEDIKALEDSDKEIKTSIEVETTARKLADDNLKSEIANLETIVVGRLQQLKQYIDVADLAMKNWYNIQLNELKEWVIEHYQKTYTLMNPWKGYKTSLDECVDDIFSVYRPLSMSCTQLDNIIPEITYIDNENLSCNDFDFNGLRVKQYLSDAYMHSPVSGRYLKLQDVISEIMTTVVVSISSNTVQSGNRAYSRAYSDNVVNMLDNGVMSSVTITTLDERLALMQPYTQLDTLDIYPQAVLQGKNLFTSDESILRYEATYNA